MADFHTISITASSFKDLLTQVTLPRQEVRLGWPRKTPTLPAAAPARQPAQVLSHQTKKKKKKKRVA